MKLLKIATVISLAASSVMAQSPLQLYGFGAPQTAGDVTSDGAGDITSLPLVKGNAFPGTVASWHNLRTTQLRMTVGTQSSTVGEADARYRTSMRALTLMIHLDNTTALGFGIRPLTQIDMNVIDASGTQIVGVDTFAYSQGREIIGGVSAFRTGFSKRINDNISVGVALDVLFGSIVQNDTLQFTNTGGRIDILSWLSLTNRNLISEQRLSFLGRAIELNIDAAAFPRDISRLGLSLRVPLSLTSRVRTRYIGSLPYLDDRNSAGSLPIEFRLAYALDFAPRQRLIVEIGQSTTKESDANKLIFGRQIDGTNSASFSWTYKPASLTSPNPGRLFYRVGLSKKAYYLSDLENTSFGEVAATLGLGVRSLRSNFQIDFAFQFGKRDALPGIEEETVARVSIGISTGELWFARPKKNWK